MYIYIYTPVDFADLDIEWYGYVDKDAYAQQLYDSNAQVSGWKSECKGDCIS